MMRLLLLLFLQSLALLAAAAESAALPDGHPVLGTWSIELPKRNCTETYHIHADGSIFVISGEEVVESVSEIALEPSAKGFYKWTDKVVKTNGRKDCAGEIVTVGQQAINYILAHPSGEFLVVCRDESLNTCFGPLMRTKAKDI